MTVTETLNEGLKRAYSLLIEAKTVADKVEAAIAEVAPQIRMPGFRPGKVPANLIRRMHGENLRREALTEAVNEAVQKLLADRGLRPATQPQIELEGESAEGADVKVAIRLEVLPDVPETDIEGIVLEKLVVEPTEAEIDTAIARLAEQQKRFEDAPEGHAAATGDQVVMDYAGTIDGTAFDGGTGEDMAIELGAGRLIPGFEEQLAGVHVGDQRTVKLAFPEDYGAAELAGKDAEFAVTVKAVKQPVEAAIDDTLATNLGLESLEQLRGILKDQVEAELNKLSRTYLKRKLLDHLAAEADFEVPPAMVEAEFEQIWAQVNQQSSPDEQADLEAERDEYRRIAERRVRLGLLLADIGQKHGVTVSQQDMNRLVAEEARRFPGQEQQVHKFFAENPVAAAQLRAPLFEDRVVDFLIGKANVSERVVDRAALEAAIADEDETPLGALPAPGQPHAHVHGPDCDHDHHGHDHDHDHAHHDHDHAGAGDAGAPAPKARKSPARKAADAQEDADGENAAADAGGTAARKPRAKKAATSE